MLFLMGGYSLLSLNSQGVTHMILRRTTFAASILLAPLTTNATPLTQLPGLTAIQQPTANAIQTVCGQLAILPGKTSEQTKLFESCRKMVQTANALAPQTETPTGYSLGLTNEQLRTAVQAAAPEEVGTMASGSLKSSAGANPVGGRLAVLRAGGRGFTLASNGDTRFSSASGGAAGETDGDSRLGGFVNFNYNLGNVDTTDLEDGFEFDNYGLVTGLDYRFSDSLVAGAALSYYQNNANLDANLGNVDASNFGASAYGSYYMGAGHIDATLSYARYNYDTVRNIIIPSFTDPLLAINTRAVGSTNGNQFTASVGGGYDYRHDTITLTPYARLSYLNLDIDGYTEYEPSAGLGLNIDSQTVTSLQSALGVTLSKTVSTSSGVFVPYGAIEWIHEFQNDASSVTAKYTNDPNNTFFVIPTISPDRDYFIASVGGSSVFANGIAAFVTLESALGLEGVNNTGLTLGLRKEF